MVYPIAPARRAALDVGMWLPLTVEGKKSATVSCPRCGQRGDLDPRSHRINSFGQVMNPWRCPAACGFVNALALHQWAATNTEIN